MTTMKIKTLLAATSCAAILVAGFAASDVQASNGKPVSEDMILRYTGMTSKAFKKLTGEERNFARDIRAGRYTPQPTPATPLPTGVPVPSTVKATPAPTSVLCPVAPQPTPTTPLPTGGPVPSTVKAPTSVLNPVAPQPTPATPLPTGGLVPSTVNPTLQPVPTGRCTPQPILATPEPIEFYDRRKPFFEFTNFFGASFVEEGQGYKNEWDTSEHYFQGKKFNVPGSRQVLEQIKATPTPRDAFNLARQNSGLARPQWDTDLKINVMFDALNRKYDAHPELKALLMATDGIPHYEVSPIDACWGTGAPDRFGPGQNMLGKLHEVLRNKYLGLPITPIDYISRDKTRFSIDFNQKLAATYPVSQTQVGITPETRNELVRMGLFGKFQQYLSNPSQGIASVGRNPGYTQPQAVYPQTTNVAINPNHSPVNANGFNTAITANLKSKFLGLLSNIEVIRATNEYGHREMKIKISDPGERGQVATIMQKRCFRIYEKAPYLALEDTGRNEIGSFLNQFLGLDLGFIKLYIKQQFNQ